MVRFCQTPRHIVPGRPRGTVVVNRDKRDLAPKEVMQHLNPRVRSILKAVTPPVIVEGFGRLNQRLMRQSPPINPSLYSRAASTAPIIIVGMHRSGTGLLVRLLERCGVFMGDKQTRNGESKFFQTLNRQMLDSFGCSWRCVDFLPETAELRDHYQRLPAMLAARLEKDLVAEHWGRHALSLLKATCNAMGVEGSPEFTVAPCLAAGDLPPPNRSR